MTLLGLKNVVWLASQAAVGVERFASLYESFQALTSVQVSHFVEWFSGDALDSIWTQNAAVGIAFNMVDEIDGGLELIGTATNTTGSINFNDKRHYAHDGSIIIGVFRGVTSTANTIIKFGLASGGFIGNDYAVVEYFATTEANFNLETKDGTTISQTSSGVTRDTSFHSHKIECASANIKLTIDGVLKVTKTTNRPTTALQPLLFLDNNNTGSGKAGRITYLEAFNTSVSITSSLYERLSALTQVMGQRVVETFEGALVNERWNDIGSGSSAMADAVDGGLIITADSSQAAGINFNNKRQYDFEDSVIISTWKRGESSTAQFARVGLINSSVSTNLALCQDDVGGGNFKLLKTGDNSSSSSTNSTISSDTNFHVVKIETGSANTLLTIDGVLEVTKSTNRPTLKMQPFVEGGATGTTSTCSIRYLEMYNKLTTETDFPSVYELFNELTTVAKSHFWEWFDGNDLNTIRWTKASGLSPIFTMQDGVDAGYSVGTGSTNNHRASFSMSTKRHYSQTASEFIAVVRSNTNITSQQQFAGFVAVNDPALSNDSTAVWQSFRQQTNFGVRTANSSAGNLDTEGSVLLDTSYHSIKIVCGSTPDVKSFIDGVLDVTTTSNLPNGKMQPIFMSRNNGGTAATQLDILYCEAYST